MSKQLDEGKFGEDLARKFLNDPIIKVNHGISHYDDVTQDKSYQDKDTDFIVWKKNVPSRGIYSNYGVPLKELRYDNTGIINKDTTIVMLGDCRNNRNYSGVEDVEWLSKRASNFFVLNPEPRDEWGQGDSIADLYAKSGAVVSQVSSAKDLLTFLQTAGNARHL